jgi:hypothetical protein
MQEPFPIATQKHYHQITQTLLTRGFFRVPLVRKLPLLWQMPHPPLCLVECLVEASFMPQLVA